MSAAGHIDDQEVEMTDGTGLLNSLRSALDAPVSGPDEPGYEVATPWNRAVQLRPLAVVHASSATDVAVTLRWAAAHDRTVTVQRTGHGAVPLSGEPVLVDTRGLDRLDVDPQTRRAQVGAGRLADEVAEAAGTHGLCPVAGAAATVSFVGVLTGGGCGPLVRTLGIGADWIRAATIVTGDGVVHEASADADADLFWALRGGRATVGIVTEVEVELAALPDFYGGCAFFADEAIPRVLRAWQRWSHHLPREATSSVCLLQLPPDAPAPPPLTGRMTLAVRLAWLGEDEEGAALAGELLSVAEPVFGGYERMPAAAIAAIHADPVDPMPSIADGFLMDDFTAEAAEALLAAAGPGSGSPLVMAEIRRMDPPARDPGTDAFCGRDARYNLLAVGVPLPDPALAQAGSDRVLDALRPWHNGRAMPSFVPSADPGLQDSFWDAATLARLQELGDRHDPAGVLRIGQVARRAVEAVSA